MPFYSFLTFLAWSQSIFNVFCFFLRFNLIKFYINKRKINLDKDYVSCGSHLWNHKRFCKILNSLVAINLLKKFQILEII